MRASGFHHMDEDDDADDRPDRVSETGRHGLMMFFGGAALFIVIVWSLFAIAWHFGGPVSPPADTASQAAPNAPKPK